MNTLFPYHRRNPLAIAKLLLCDLCYYLYANLFRRNINLPKTLNRILLVNPAHLGDVVISTTILRELKLQLPNCKVDFLVGDWSAPILKDHPGVNEVFYISHWQANRSEETFTKKKQKYQQQANEVISALKTVSYNAIFFLNSYEPSLIALFKEVKCPLIGLVSAGGGPLLSYRGDSSAMHEVQIQASLFISWLGKFKGLDQYKPWLKTPVASDRLNTELRLNRPYVVIHPGSGNPAKEWPIGNWAEVLGALAQYDLDVVITGHGEREKAQANLLSSHRVTNLVSRLNFEEFVNVVDGAIAIFCVDSVAGHIAGACNKKTIIIGNGLSNIKRWQPLGDSITLLENKVSCSPCHNNTCAQRMCVTGVDPKRLIDQLPNILRI